MASRSATSWLRAIEQRRSRRMSPTEMPLTCPALGHRPPPGEPRPSNSGGSQVPRAPGVPGGRLALRCVGAGSELGRLTGCGRGRCATVERVAGREDRSGGLGRALLPACTSARRQPPAPAEARWPRPLGLEDTPPRPSLPGGTKTAGARETRAPSPRASLGRRRRLVTLGELTDELEASSGHARAPGAQSSARASRNKA